MQYSTITKPNVTETAEFSARVPFHRNLTLVEDTLSENTLFTPVEEPGTPEEFKPLPGSLAIYSLYADGSSVPTFGRPFLIDPHSTPYNSTPGALNILTFMFDGVDFWVKIISELTEQPLELIGDFGYGPLMIAIAGTSSVSSAIFEYHAVNTGQITAFDILTAVHYLGNTDDEPLTYYISKSKLGPWESSTDPRYAALTFTCSEVGPRTVYVKVGNGISLPDSNLLACSVDIQDNNRLC